jgi:hypothetical protein
MKADGIMYSGSFDLRNSINSPASGAGLPAHGVSQATSRF